MTSDLRVALIESQDLNKSRQWKPSPDAYSNRCSSLTPSSIAFLQKIGTWSHIDQARVQPYQEMQVWDGQNGSRISFDWSIEKSPFEDHRTVATMIENANLVRGLLARIDSLGGGNENTAIFSNTTVSGIQNGQDYADGPDLSAWPVLSLSSSSPSATTTAPTTIAARLLVGADGINSPVRSFADIETTGWDYNRHGIVATFELSESTTSTPAESLRTAYQRFLPALGGPTALLPLPNNRASLVWSTTVENAAYLKSLPAEAFTAMVNAAFRLSMTDMEYMLRLEPSATDSGTKIGQHQDELDWRLQHTPQPSSTSSLSSSPLPPLVTAVQPGSVASFPLRFRHAASYISPRVALVGDAAHVIHPLAGQGLNLGLGDVASLSDAMEFAISHGMDIGDLLSLERYASERYLVNAKVGGACDLLHKLYNVRGNGPIAWGRGVGLGVLDKLPMLKGFLMKVAEG